jgi:hypothetical protein
MPITNPDQLRRHIELAIQVELSTIPPYLFAMYSIADQSSEAALLIRSIVAEEMLHAALATNLLLAVGGAPDFAGSGYMPTYPMNLPHHQPPLRLELAPCSVDLIEDVFMRIEKPEAHDAPAQPDRFETLGQFYHALEIGLLEVADRFDLFSQPGRDAQMSDPSFYRPVAMDAEDSGGLVLIDDMTSAIDAIEIIVHQGEGLTHGRWADPGHQELTHYHKLLQIKRGVIPLGEVLPLRRNPTAAGFPDDLRVVADLFNSLYRGAYLALDRIFAGTGEQSRAVGVLYLLMGDLMSRVGRFLTHRELADGDHAAPTFEIRQFAEGDPFVEMSGLADMATSSFPELDPVADAVHGLGLSAYPAP